MAGLFFLFVVYAGWSGTYLAIRVAVREGSGFPPLSMVGSRLGLAGAILFLWAVLARGQLRPSRRELPLLIGSACLMWLGGNGLVTLAEQRAASGLAALLVASTPIWAAVINALIDRRRPSWLFIGSLLVGFAGVAVLAAPAFDAGGQSDVLAIVALLVAPASWAVGSILQARRPVSLGPLANSAYQHFVGFAGFVILALTTSEPRAAPTAEAWWGWAYLVVIGSVVTFTSFLRALRALPTNVVMTYAYVNPVGALLLGALVLQEAITVNTLLGAGLVLLGVAGVFQDQRRAAPSSRGSH